MNLSTLLYVLPAIGPVMAALPEFKQLFDEVKATLSTHDQEVAQNAYDLAITRAGNAHTQLQDLVRRHGG